MPLNQCTENTKVAKLLNFVYPSINVTLRYTPFPSPQVPSSGPTLWMCAPSSSQFSHMTSICHAHTQPCSSAPLLQTMYDYCVTLTSAGKLFGHGDFSHGKIYVGFVLITSTVIRISVMNGITAPPPPGYFVPSPGYFVPPP